VDNVLDERRDPLVSTRAAAVYLKENHQKLDSWPLALTAYNHGVNGMLRAKNQIGEYDRVFGEYCSPSFGFASRNFYPCFLAAREASTNRERYFGKIELAKPVQTVAMTMPGYAYLKNVIRNLGVGAETIRELNPALRPSVYRGQKYLPKGYCLRVPAPGAVSSDVMLAQMPVDIFRNEQKRDRVHVVQKGDTAFRIARMHNIGLSDLITANNLCRSAVLRPGQCLKIPNSAVGSAICVK
jgi:membrane-bound lytic murein transglycosylase D